MAHHLQNFPIGLFLNMSPIENISSKALFHFSYVVLRDTLFIPWDKLCASFDTLGIAFDVGDK